MYFCKKCNQEFELKPDAMPPEMEYGGGPEMENWKPDCPTCNDKKQVVPMVKCPQCKKYYVSPRQEYDEKMSRGQDMTGVEPPKDICPHCKTDRMQWYRNRRTRK